jgi:hypothetical protein
MFHAHIHKNAICRHHAQNPQQRTGGHFPTSTKAWLSAAATELPLLPMGERFRRQLNLSAQQFIQRPERSLWG